MTHPEFRYDAEHDIVLVRCGITGFWHTAQDPEGAAYCEGCSESVAAPSSAQRPQMALPPSVPVVSVLEEERKDAQKPKTLPCGHVSHEDGGPADYSARCRR